ncbi:MAG: pentapeptide repeat-containing protein [Cyanobacteria bacterium P01_A01_bin.135]
MTTMQRFTMAATVKASVEGLERVDKARRKKGWTKSERVWADLACTSVATLKRFWVGVAIQSDTFRDICTTAGINDWESVIDLEERDKQESQVSPKRLSFAIAGSIEEVDASKLKAIVALLQKLGGDATIEILDVEEGSIRLILGGSVKSLQEIETLFQLGRLEQIEDVDVQDVHFLDKSELTHLIQANICSAQNFSGVVIKNADLSGAYLRDANLSGANLSGTNLSNADLSNADLSSSNTNLSGTNFSGANLSSADLSNTNLRNAYLRDADLSGAVFRSANLSNADLINADFSSADVEQCIMTGSIGLSPEAVTSLKNRGAIFEDFPEDRESLFSPNPLIPR